MEKKMKRVDLEMKSLVGFGDVYIRSLMGLGFRVRLQEEGLQVETKEGGPSLESIFTPEYLDQLRMEEGVSVTVTRE